MKQVKTTLAAALLATVIAAPVWAQILPTVTITGGNTEGTSVLEDSGAGDGCISGFDVVFSRNTTQDTTFRVMILRVSGYDYFRNHGVEAFYSPEVSRPLTPTIQTFTMPSGQGTAGLPSGFDVCWLDDIIDSEIANSRFEMRVLPIPGYDTRNAVRTFSIDENDNCGSPQSTPGGVVKISQGGNRTCVCATKSLVEVTPYDGYTPLTSEGSNLRDHEKALLFNDIPTYGESSLNWTTDSTNYCPDSPYQKPN
ncbi:MAG: hypothetical protein OXC62_01655 [Aestuariivita sp.]|nr:hypothetical protein [Aestuariivita sp.]